MPDRSKTDGVGKLRESPAFFERLVYHKYGRPRFTQDSPVLLDVFTHFGHEGPGKRQSLLLTPDWSRSPGELAERLRKSLGEAQIDATDANAVLDPLAETESPVGDHQVAFNKSVVAVDVTFSELLLHVLPLSQWWNRWLVTVGEKTPVGLFADPNNRDLGDVAEFQLSEGLSRLQEQRQAMLDDAQPAHTGASHYWFFNDDLVWAAHLFYTIANCTPTHDASTDEPDVIARWFRETVRKLPPEREIGAREEPWVFAVNRNRPINRSTRLSIPTTKADAVHRTFDTRGEGIRWAIVDAGIDATHLAFRRVDEVTGVAHTEPFQDGANNTRVRATYDFSSIRRKLSQEQRRSFGSATGRSLDWEALETQLRLRVPHTAAEYRVPRTSHGTHVAGVLAAKWDPQNLDLDPVGPPVPRVAPSAPVCGMCPELDLYDLRVFDGDVGDEFAVMSALQFIRSLNQRHDSLEVHGANVSLAVIHDVANYACGRSPICEESGQLVASGVVVVAAAGNNGRASYTSLQGQTEEGYRTVSIADPGNAESVITVGSTHRQAPHTYGVSYFSSRGPTGDGRMKPDLVAPGEKVYSTVPGNRFERQDGTSQAAPHVSGAAALLMSRHPELIGQPGRIKQILMDSATDLGRERAFQGAGLVDVMRAMQSV